jgi:Pentapeptide repeats (8 copies)
MDASEIKSKYAAGERDFQDVDLEGANLGWVRLSGANLRQAKLHRVNLSGADLKQVDLRDSNLAFADLSRADLTEANLKGATLEGANLDRSILTSIIFDDQTRFPKGFEQGFERRVSNDLLPESKLSELKQPQASDLDPVQNNFQQLDNDLRRNFEQLEMEMRQKFEQLATDFRDELKKMIDNLTGLPVSSDRGGLVFQPSDPYAPVQSQNIHRPDFPDSPASQSLDPARLSNPWDQIVEIYNSNPEYLESVAVGVGETEGSIHRRQQNNGSQSVTLTQVSNSMYWVVVGQDFRAFWVVPKRNFKLHPVNFYTFQSLFDFPDYRPGLILHLVRPARVERHPSGEWELEEKGEVEFI